MKKYSEEFADYSNILKTAIIGFEFEFYIKDMSFYVTLDYLNKYLSPIQVYGFRQYHPGFKPTENKFMLTPDLSSVNLVEIITGPISFFEARFYLIKILKFIQEYGYTDEKASIHINISFTDKSLNNLNILKLILNIDEDEIYRDYPSRKNNIYTKSIIKIIPYKEYDFNDVPIDVVKNSLRLPNDKYYGINFTHLNKDKSEQRLEFRYLGGTDYEKNIGQIVYHLNKFILTVNKCLTPTFTENEMNKLENILDKSINTYKSFYNYDNFLINFPNITLQVDRVSDYDLVSALYLSIYDKLFTIIDSTENLNNCIFNWIIAEQKLEIVDATIKCVVNVNNYDFINCIITGILTECNIVNSQVSNSQLITCDINSCETKSSKIINCVTENSNLTDCYAQMGYINSTMIGGIIRSDVKLGQYANISSTTKTIEHDDNFFHTKFDDDKKKKLK
jgi:hypothetical protein